MVEVMRIHPVVMVVADTSDNINNGEMINKLIT